MCKKRVTEMRVTQGTYGEIMKRHSLTNMGDKEYRSMLVSLKPKCFIETSRGQSGNIIEIKRDEWDVPVAVDVLVNTIDPDTGDLVGEHHEWIDVREITFWEAWDFIAPLYLFDDDNAVMGELMFESEVL